jgi:calcium-dependent phosphoinositide phospholipase C
MKKLLPILFIGIIYFSCGKTESEEPMLNQIQVIGSHNSYKLRMDPLIWQGVFAEDSVQAMQLDYGHITLREQLDLGLRSLEIDVYHDPQGGKFKDPFGLKMIEMVGATPSPFDTSIMTSSGLKVLHNHDFDFRSNCGTFKICLDEIKTWSALHPDHLPVIITLNTKEEFINRPGFTRPYIFSKAALDTIDLEIQAVFSKSQLITPDDIRGDLPSLENAVLTNGWGTLANTRGKLLFVLDQNNEVLDRYIENHPGLKNRIMFANAPVGTPEAAFLIMNEPIDDFEVIQQRVKQGYLVRTRADAGTWEARRNDKTRFEKAIASGAQVISTDYYIPDEKLETGYQIQLPGGVYSRINESIK